MGIFIKKAKRDVLDRMGKLERDSGGRNKLCVCVSGIKMKRCSCYKDLCLEHNRLFKLLINK